MAYQTVKELTNTKQRRVSVIQDKTGKCLTEEHEMLTRFTEYCSGVGISKGRKCLRSRKYIVSTNYDNNLRS